MDRHGAFFLTTRQKWPLRKGELGVRLPDPDRHLLETCDWPQQRDFATHEAFRDNCSYFKGEISTISSPPKSSYPEYLRRLPRYDGPAQQRDRPSRGDTFDLVSQYGGSCYSVRFVLNTKRRGLIKSQSKDPQSK